MTAIIALSGCRKAELHSPPGTPVANQPFAKPAPIGDAPEMGSQTLRGNVTDEAGNPLPGVDVYYYGYQTQTDASGYYSIPVMNKLRNRVFVQFRKAGYFPMDAGFTPDTSGFVQLQVALSEKKYVGKVTSNNPEPVVFGPVTLTFPPNAFLLNGQLYTGVANVFATYLDPLASNFRQRMPGRDMVGVDERGRVGTLVSQGAYMVEARTPTGELLEGATFQNKNTTSGYQTCIQYYNPPAILGDVWVSYQGTWHKVTTPNYNNFTNQLCFTTPFPLYVVNIDVIYFGANPPTTNPWNPPIVPALNPPPPPAPSITVNITYCDTADQSNVIHNFFLRATYQDGQQNGIPGSFFKVNNQPRNFQYTFSDAEIVGLSSVEILKNGTPIYTYNGPFFGGLTFPLVLNNCTN